MTLEKLRDDDRVVHDRVGSRDMIFLERYDKARQVVTGDRVDRAAVAEELPEVVEYGFIFAMSVGHFQRGEDCQATENVDVRSQSAEPRRNRPTIEYLTCSMWVALRLYP